MQSEGGRVQDHKIFSRDDYDKHDPVGKMVGRWLFQRHGFNLLPDLGEEFSAGDFWVQKGTDIHLVEAEHKVAWKDKDKWPAAWKTVHCPYRKRHSRSRYFFVVNEPCTMALIVNMKRVKESEVTTIPKTTWSENERFFNVPLSKAGFYNLLEMGLVWDETL